MEAGLSPETGARLQEGDGEDVLRIEIFGTFADGKRAGGAIEGCRLSREAFVDFCERSENGRDLIDASSVSYVNDAIVIRGHPVATEKGAEFGGAVFGVENSQDRGPRTEPILVEDGEFAVFQIITGSNENDCFGVGGDSLGVGEVDGREDEVLAQQSVGKHRPRRLGAAGLNRGFVGEKVELARSAFDDGEEGGGESVFGLKAHRAALIVLVGAEDDEVIEPERAGEVGVGSGATFGAGVDEDEVVVEGDVVGAGEVGGRIGLAHGVEKLGAELAVRLAHELFYRAFDPLIEGRAFSKEDRDADWVFALADGVLGEDFLREIGESVVLVLGKVPDLEVIGREVGGREEDDESQQELDEGEAADAEA